MAVRDGDGWVDCVCGLRHWGLHGAAGLLLLSESLVLLQHRAHWVHNGDTWGIPGGARDSHENGLEAALRESREEIGIEAQYVTAHFSHLDDHGAWSYETIVATMSPNASISERNHETLDLRWFAISDVENSKLHPSFAKSWPVIRQKLTKLGI
jgi:8-oxo-dGTP diphosphatase